MGRKVHPFGFRLGTIRDWQAHWFAEKGYTELLHEDLHLRRLVLQELAEAWVSKVEIERSANLVSVTIHTAKPGIVIGKGGTKVEALRQMLEAEINAPGRPPKKVRLNIHEIRQPELDAYLVARNVAEQIEKRVAYKRAMKQAVSRALKLGAKGVKVTVAGRLAGAEMCRREWERAGRVPLQTLRADIDFGQTEAHTTFGRIGIKAWIYKGDILPPPKKAPMLAPKVESIPPAVE